MIKKLLGLRIRQLRKKMNLTQFALGEKINVDQRQIAYIEGGNCFPSLKTLKKLADTFNCQIKDLFDYEHLTQNRNLEDEIHRKIHSSSARNLNLYYSLINAIENYA
ncbi:helix-turn-helix transcriptional regulator [bacterium]|nr:helix-turn-helix transcriptional regulator [bacterium]